MLQAGNKQLGEKQNFTLFSLNKLWQKKQSRMLSLLSQIGSGFSLNPQSHFSVKVHDGTSEYNN